ncbi:unnamed protein product, partial [Trichogramma brassicae]
MRILIRRDEFITREASLVRASLEANGNRPSGSQQNISPKKSLRTKKRREHRGRSRYHLLNRKLCNQSVVRWSAAINENGKNMLEARRASKVRRYTRGRESRAAWWFISVEAANCQILIHLLKCGRRSLNYSLPTTFSEKLSDDADGGVLEHEREGQTKGHQASGAMRNNDLGH